MNQTQTEAPQTVRLAAEDNVVVALSDVAEGAAVDSGAVVAKAAVPAGHKIATAEIAEGESVRKYGQVIGFASTAIHPGEHVHVHNVTVRDFARDYAFGADRRAFELLPEAERATFMGIRRADGRVGTRNRIAVIATSNCAATVVNRIAEAFKGDALADFPNVDEVFPVSHGQGCGMNPSPESIVNLERCLIGYARHPNVAGFILVGLGCEDVQPATLARRYGIEDGPLARSFLIQEVGGSIATTKAGIEAIRAMLPIANAAVREPVPVSELVIALQCGGSDGYSGITANPGLGVAADLLVRNGATVILGETTEIYGAEHLLTRRAVSTEVGEKLVAKIHWWEDHFKRFGGEMNNNPSTGNKKGGLTTILEKSLGAVVKGGTSDLTKVFDYAEPVSGPGLIFMDGPGYDNASTTGMVAGGANVVCFTTGRGSVVGWKPAPTIKLASNSTMYRHMEDDMDINCGVVLDGTASLQELGEDIYRTILAVASGEKTKSEEFGFGDSEFAPWRHGAVT